jgi:hypothetical protein
MVLDRSCIFTTNLSSPPIDTIELVDHIPLIHLFK